MAINIDAIRGRLNKLQNTQKKSDNLWKPTPGKHQVRIVPYKFEKDNPFIELYFHYNINNKTYLSPQSFGRPDPIVEFADRLKRMGDKEDWKAAKQMEPKLRTFVPILVRGQEGEGIKFWGSCGWREFGMELEAAGSAYESESKMHPVMATPKKVKK